MARVRVLYITGCPHVGPTLRSVRRALDERGERSSLEVLEVRSSEEAQRFRFLGSPTVQVDGVDVEPSARGRLDFAVSCRLYDAQGHPPEEMIASALQGVES